MREWATVPGRCQPDVDVEFDRQVRVLVDADCPAFAGLSPEVFVDLLEPLRKVTRTAGDSPWLIVLSESLIPASSLVPLLRLPGSDRPGVVDRNFGDELLDAYRPLPTLGVPDAPAYLLLGVERGDEFRGVRPKEAVPVIESRGRTPLTIHEGLAFALQVPSSLQKNHCYMLAGSRAGHKRVPAIWIADKAPKLGWCWDGNHHTWLGIASAEGRRGPLL